MRPCFCTCLRKRGNTNKRGLSPCHTKVFIQGTPVPSSVPVVDLFWRPPSKLPLLARSVPFQLPPPEWKLKKHQLCCVEELEASQSWQSAYVEHGDLRIKVSQIAKQCPNRQAAARSWGWERWEWEGEAARRPEDDKTHSLLLISFSNKTQIYEHYSIVQEYGPMVDGFNGDEAKVESWKGASQ